MGKRFRRQLRCFARRSLVGSRGSFSAGFSIFLSIMLLTLPLPWIVSMGLAAAFHELCHFLAIRACGCHCEYLYLNVQSAMLDLPPMSRRKELLCALAGPLGSFLLILLIRWMPRIAVCGVMQGLYNLLPVYPMDGGRILQCCCAMLFSPPTAKKISKWVEVVVYLLLIALGLYATVFLRLGLLPLIMVLLICLRTKRVKFPCKPRKERVQ